MFLSGGFNMCFYQRVNPVKQKHSHLIAAMGILLLFCSYGYSATLAVPAGYKTIQEAIDKANSGDTVLVEPGTYKEVLKLKPGVVLKSRGSEKELTDFTAAARTIISSPGQQTTIVEGADGAVIDGFTLADQESDYDPTAWRFGVLIQGKSQTVTNCRISRLPYDGIGIFGLQSDSESYIYHNLISENRGTGVKCQAGAKASILLNQIYENKQSGIENHKGVESLISWNTIFKNGIDGVVSAGARPVIKNNEIYANVHNGIGLQRGSRGEVLKNKIYENAQSGVGIRMDAKGTLKENRIYRNTVGIGCLDLDEVKIEANEIYENKRVGIGLQGCAGRAVTIINNHIHDNQFVPIMPNPGCNLVQSGNRF